MSLKRFQFHVLVWSQFRLDKVAIAVEAAHTVLAAFVESGGACNSGDAAKAGTSASGGGAPAPSAQSKLSQKQQLAAEAALELGQQ